MGGQLEAKTGQLEIKADIVRGRDEKWARKCEEKARASEDKKAPSRGLTVFRRELFLIQKRQIAKEENVFLSSHHQGREEGQ